jgi:tRNA nucleotidyltransferase/poly(A) polymerase
MNQIPWPWKKVLAEVQTVWPQAVIAGGALRDWDHERGVKDVDVFVPARALGEVERLFPDAKKCDLDDASVFGADIPYYYTFTRFGWLFETTFRDRIEKLLDEMDVGLCLIKFDGNEVTSAVEYRKDSHRKTITLLRRTGGEEAHVARMASKYPDFRLVNKADGDLEFLSRDGHLK